MIPARRYSRGSGAGVRVAAVALSVVLGVGAILNDSMSSANRGGSAYAGGESFAGDADGDLAVGVSDLEALARHWLERGCDEPGWCGGADLDRSERVDFGDLAILGGDWGRRIKSMQSHRTHIDDLNWHGVPYECLLPLGIENLLTAGKCISASHNADKWIRVQSCCMATGQAAGTAAALSVEKNNTPRKLSVSMLQDCLKSQGVSLKF